MKLRLNRPLQPEIQPGADPLPAPSTKLSASVKGIAMSKLHDEIMNLPAHPTYETAEQNLAFKEGHKVARHAAAELANGQANEFENEIEQLKARILDLDSQLQPYLERERRDERVQAIAQLLAPGFKYGIPRQDEPLAHPDCRGWQTGGSIVEHYQDKANEGHYLEMEYYYNGGRDEMRMVIPEEWFHADNYPDLVKEFLINLHHKIAEEKAQDELESAQAELEKAQRRLNDLKSKS
jgi:hypothetical protein